MEKRGYHDVPGNGNTFASVFLATDSADYIGENPSHFYHLSSFSIIKRVQRVLPKLHAKRAIIRTLTVTYGTLQKKQKV